MIGEKIHLSSLIRNISLNTFFGVASYVVVREMTCLDELLSFAIKFPSAPPVVDNVLNNSIFARNAR